MRPSLVYDPYDPEIDAAPHAVWRRLRDEAPLYYNAEYDFYALSRFADVMAASLDWQSYSSAAEPCWSSWTRRHQEMPTLATASE